MPKDTIVRKSAIDKRGVFALRDFRKGEVVLKWRPKILKKSEADKLPNKEKHYIKKSGKKYFLMQAPEKFVNHSCGPNTEVKNSCDIAIKNIKKGEEITSDYGEGEAISFQCKCGSKNCRGDIE